VYTLLTTSTLYWITTNTSITDTTWPLLVVNTTLSYSDLIITQNYLKSKKKQSNRVEQFVIFLVITGTQMPHVITMLPATRQRWHSSLYPSQLKLMLDLTTADASLSWPSWLVYILKLYIRPKMVIHPSTNWVQHRLTLFTQLTMLLLCQTANITQLMVQRT